MVNANYAVTINSNSYSFIALRFDHEGRDVAKIPSFSVLLPNMFGVLATSQDIKPGKVVRIYRNNVLVFSGVIKPYQFNMSKDQSTVEIRGVNLYYNKLDNIICDSYDFLENSKDYGVTINPWEFKVFRHTHPQVTLDELTGERPILDGFSADKVAQHIIGTKFLYGHDFTDAAHILPSSLSAINAYSQVYRNSQTYGNYYQTTPRLQLLPNGFLEQAIAGNLYDVSAVNTDGYRIHNGMITSVSQGFRYSQNFTLASVKLSLTKTGSPSGNVTLRLSTSRTSGGITQTVAASSIITGMNAFSSAVGFNGTANTEYFLTLSYTGGDASNYIGWYYNASAPYQDGSAYYTNGVEYLSSADMVAQILGSTIANTQMYQAGGTVESISLANGDANIEAMGGITSVTATLYGRRNSAGNNVHLYVSRRGQPSFGQGGFNKANRQYYSPSSVAFSQVAVPGTIDFVDKWVFTYNFFGDLPQENDNQLAYYIGMENRLTTSTPEIEYVLFECDVATDTGITSGTIETYTGDPTITDSNYFEGNVESLSRLQALQKVRESTIKLYDVTNPYNVADTELTSFWDIWVDVNGLLNFKKVRGNQINRTYSFENRSYTDIQYEYDGNDIWYKVIAYGAGSGVVRTRIVDPDDVGADFTQPGLTNNTARTLYGDAAKQGTFEDSNAVSIKQLQKKARAMLKIHSRPFETLRLPAGIIPEYDVYYNVGDSLRVTITDLNINERFYPIEELTRSVDKDGEAISIVLGSGRSAATAITNAIVNNNSSQQDIHIVRQPRDNSLSASTASGTFFDNMIYGVYSFGISDPENVKRVALKMVTVPYSIQITGADATNVFFGIRTFDGGNGQNINAAIYASGINVWIDTVNPPTINDTQNKLQLAFGVPDKSVEIDEIDITSRLARDGTGNIKRGIHRVWIKSTMSAAPNPQGLGCIQVVPLIDYKV